MVAGGDYMMNTSDMAAHQETCFVARVLKISDLSELLITHVRMTGFTVENTIIRISSVKFSKDRNSTISVLAHHDTCIIGER